MDYGRRHGDHGRLPVTVNVCLEEFCNIGKLMDFKRVLNVCRGSAIFCQIIVQSIPQLQDSYPKTEWEELIDCTDIQICLGCNDVDTATYISKKCGMSTIKVENNQMPLTPLFSPLYTSTRPYSQTKSNTQRALMLPDEHPSFGWLRDVKVSDYIPHWRQEEEQAARTAKPRQENTAPPPAPAQTGPVSAQPDPAPAQPVLEPEQKAPEPEAASHGPSGWGAPVRLRTFGPGAGRLWGAGPGGGSGLALWGL